MSTLLIGRWDGDHTLTITESHQVNDGDQHAIDALTAPAFSEGTANWACEFDVDRHRDAVQRTYEEFVRDDEAHLVDDVEGYEPATD
ncbi:hypothetical protein [Streptacidiphilus jiangxiensis]|uniref:Uncharacterized protein n=1 Tax=Streptacidiphilus jiangxiensis TaxID=235985 RepID=A0A1H8B8Q5_STRJI|nr:hypothetical protein [Streptacidiphilus jiangxiensis]SEM79183.1 hypothetical protein SAMN05414137_15915 [Streptacidiphilus jiangxiensis]